MLIEFQLPTFSVRVLSTKILTSCSNYVEISCFHQSNSDSSVQKIRTGVIFSVCSGSSGLARSLIAYTILGNCSFSSLEWVKTNFLGYSLVLYWCIVSNSISFTLNSFDITTFGALAHVAKKQYKRSANLALYKPFNMKFSSKVIAFSIIA